MDSDVDADPTNHDIYLGKNGVAWVLRFGGLCTLVSLTSRFSYKMLLITCQIGAVMARMVPPTRTEHKMRRMLAEMKELRKSDTASP